jgi:membrane protein
MMPLSDSSPLMRKLPLDHMRNLYRFALRRLDEERLPQVAGSLTFTTVLALVPMLTIAFAIFTAFPLFQTFRASLEAYFIQSLMPRGIANTILGYLNQFAGKATRLSVFGAGGLVLTTIVMMLTIDRAFNHIWRVKTARPFAHRLMIYWTIVTLGPLLVGVSLTVTSYLFSATGGISSGYPLLSASISTVISILLTAAAFTLLYVVVPNRLVKWRDAACGGLLAAVAFEIAKRVFFVFITQFPAYRVIYGALAALPIFLIWIYVSWLITLMGAVLTAALPVVKYERWWHVPTAGSEIVDAMAVLRVLHDARASRSNAAVDAGDIRRLTRQGFDESESLLGKMLDAGWVARVKATRPRHAQLGKRIIEGADSWVLVVNLAQLTVAEVYRKFGFSAGGDAALVLQVEEMIDQGLGQSLTAHFEKTLKRTPALSAFAST